MNEMKKPAFAGFLLLDFSFAKSIKKGKFLIFCVDNFLIFNENIKSHF